MIITLKKEAQQEKIDQLIHRFENMGLQVTVIYGENYNVFGLVGDTSKVDEKNVMANPIVANVQRVDEPYKLVYSVYLGSFIRKIPLSMSMAFPLAAKRSS